MIKFYIYGVHCAERSEVAKGSSLMHDWRPTTRTSKLEKHSTRADSRDASAHRTRKDGGSASNQRGHARRECSLDGVLRIGPLVGHSSITHESTALKQGRKKGKLRAADVGRR